MSVRGIIGGIKKKGDALNRKMVERMPEDFKKMYPQKPKQKPKPMPGVKRAK